MRRISSLVFCLVASTTSAYAGDFCEGRAANRLPATLEKLTSDPANRLAFENEGGLINGGVCWWHSRFQRAAWYLAEFRPELPAPTIPQAKAFIRKLVARNGVVTIPGFRDLAQFSSVYREEIQRQLNAWQIRDSFINQAYVRGLSGRARFRHASAMKARLDRVFASFLSARTTGQVLFLMLQMRGVVSHASLLKTMAATPDGGYRLEMVDSNFPSRSVEYVYRPGDLELHPANIDVEDYTSVPYVGYGRDLTRIRRAIARHCSRG